MNERATQRSRYPLTIPHALLRSEAMRLACAERNFQEIFRLVNRRTGSSHAAMAAAIGRMTSSRVSDVIRGVRGIRGPEVVERVADGFGIPGEMLGLPPRPWEGSPSITGQAGPSTYAETDGEPSAVAGEPDPPSDTLLISVRVEGREHIVPVSRRALLGGAVGAALPVAALPWPAQSFHLLGDEELELAIRHFQEMGHTLVRAVNLFGPRYTLASVRQQYDVLEALLEHARAGQRLRLLSLAAQYAESAAWLYEDSADTIRAGEWTTRAMGWAVEAGDQSMLTRALFRKAQQAATRGNAAQAIGLATAVRRNEAVLTGPMRAAALQQEAQGHALDGDETACHRVLDQAHDFAASPVSCGDARDGHGDFCTPGYIEIQRAKCWLTLGRPDLAAPALERALADVPGIYRRDRGLARAFLAMAYAGTGECERGAAEARAALDVARASGSNRTLYEVIAAVNALVEAGDTSVVAELLNAVKGSPEH